MRYDAETLAKAIGATLEGDGLCEVTGVASPERASATQLVYLQSPRHFERVVASAARCVVAGMEVAIAGKTVLRSSNPKLSFAKAGALLAQRASVPPGVHPTAIVAESAKIGSGSSIGPYAVIGEGTQIGNNTQIGPHVVIGSKCNVGDSCRVHARVTLYSNVKIGDRVEIHAGAVMGADGFGYVFGEGRHWKFPQQGSVEIGDDVEIGANATIDRGSLEDTQISRGAKLDNLVHVGHNVRIGEHTVIAAQSGISGSSTLGRNVILGGQVGVADHCTLQDGAVAGAQAGIPTGKTIRSGQTVWGTPARELTKFKETYVWYARLPELAERIRKLEAAVRVPRADFE